MDIATLSEICLQAFQIMLRGFNTVALSLSYTVDEALTLFGMDFPFTADLVEAVTGLLGLGDLKIIEVVFGGIILVLVGSFARWIRGLLP